MEDIDVVQGDTDRVPAGHGTFNSRSIAVGGSAAFTVAHKIFAKATQIAAAMLQVKAEAVTYSAGNFWIAGPPEQRGSVAAGARMAFVGGTLPTGMEPGLDEIIF